MLSPIPRVNSESDAFANIIATGRADLPYHRGIHGRVVILPSLEAGGHRQTRHINVVFDDDRNAVQWTAWSTARPQQIIKPIGLFERTRIDCDQRIDERAAFVIGLDPIEMGLGDSARGGAAGYIGRFEVGDGCLLDSNRACSRLGQRKAR
jgi:hypothetical protein